jgi:hypothetical protein
MREGNRRRITWSVQPVVPEEAPRSTTAAAPSAAAVPARQPESQGEKLGRHAQMQNLIDYHSNALYIAFHAAEDAMQRCDPLPGCRRAAAAALVHWRGSDQVAAREAANAALLEVTNPAGEPVEIPFAEDAMKRLLR